MPPRRALAPTGGTAREMVFARPQALPEDWYRVWEQLVSDMRRESQALPMSTMMALLVERIATMYVQVRMEEGARKSDWEYLRSVQALWLKFMTEFATQLHRHSQSPEQRFVAGFKAAVNSAVRRAGPEATVRELLPILAEELEEFDVLGATPIEGIVETSLEKVLRLANVDQVQPADVGIVDNDDIDDEVHHFLMKECPWYENVVNGHPQHTPPEHCGRVNPPKGKTGGVIYKLTPRTPEASTVHEPTVPPGGPGLFHHKGLQLPPYIQHLWHHLAPKYGKHRAYAMAVGIVKKWAAGVNPGGWKTKSGKGKKTHADVRAAAAKNVAEWERDRHMGGKKKGG